MNHPLLLCHWQPPRIGNIGLCFVRYLTPTSEPDTWQLHEGRGLTVDGALLIQDIEGLWDNRITQVLNWPFDVVERFATLLPVNSEQS